MELVPIIAPIIDRLLWATGGFVVGSAFTAFVVWRVFF